MAWKEKKFTNVATSIPLSRGFVKATEMSSFVNKRIRDSQYDYHETEAFEVTEVILNKPGNRASVKGTFINNPNQPIKGDVVKPKNPNIVAVPVIGEQVDVIELNGQHFYTSIVNLKGSVNENYIPGVSGGYVKNTKYGEKFERKNVKQLEIGEGCVLYEGRFGQSIHFDGHHNVPSIKIRTNIDTGEGDLTTENLDTDDSSIYLTSDGLRGKSFAGKKIEGKNIIIKSDNIFISGKTININSESGDTIKMGNPKLPMKPTVRGDVLLKFQADITTLLGDIQSLLAIPDAKIAAVKAVSLLPKIKNVVETVTKQKFLNKEILAS